MPVSKVKHFLDASGIKYVTIRHSPAYTAQEIAASAHIPGKDLAKAVMVKIDGRMAMAVLPASMKIDFSLLQNVTGADKIELAGEQEFKGMFVDCEIGAMPPFGNLYGMDVFVDETLTEDEEIAFNAALHTELIKLSYKDYQGLVNPVLGKFSKT